jgi:cell division protein FtsW
MRIILSILQFALATLLLIGLLMLYSSTTYHLSLARVESQFCWVGLGVACYWITSRLHYNRLRQWHLAECLVAGAILLLLAVLVPGIGVFRNGAARWLPFGQPSECAKIALLIFLADYAAKHSGRMQERNAGFLLPAGIASLAALLIFAEPDWGTAALLVGFTLTLLFIAGTHWGYLASAFIIGVELFALLLARNTMRLQRILAFLDPEQYQRGIGWQGWHSLLALGCGGCFGVFVGNGSQKNGFVPEQQTDFILSLIGEELGFAGTVTVLILFMIIVLCGVRIAWKVADPFGQLLAAGATILIALQALINIGVVTSSLPNKGIALPFLSYGGSNMLCMLVSAGLLASVARHGQVLPPAPVAIRTSTPQVSN